MFYFDDNFHHIPLWVSAFTHTSYIITRADRSVNVPQVAGPVNRLGILVHFQCVA